MKTQHDAQEEKRADHFTMGQISNLTASSLFDENLCNHQVCNVYFIKVHKTGSTTMQNILYRFGFKRKLPFSLFACGNGMPFPNPAYSKYMVKDMPYKHFNIMPEHAFYLPDAFRSYMPLHTKVLSLLRHPLENLKSTISFHGLSSKMGFKSKRGDFLEGFLKNPHLYDARAKFAGSSTDCGPFRAPSYTKNAMAYHFGLNNQSEQDSAKLWHFVKELDKTVDLVLILESFDESLILMRRHFNWSTEDILYLQLWSLKFHGKPDIKLNMKSNRTKNLIAKHEQWSPGDYILYKYFSEKMYNLLSQQNQDFWDEVKMFKRLLVKTKSFCKSMCSSLDSVSHGVSSASSQFLKEHFVFAESKWSRKIVLTRADCITMMLATLDYQEALKVLQVPGYCDRSYRKRKSSKQYCNTKDHVIYTFPWKVVKSKILGSKQTCLRYFQIA